MPIKILILSCFIGALIGSIQLIYEYKPLFVLAAKILYKDQNFKRMVANCSKNDSCEPRGYRMESDPFVHKFEQMKYLANLKKEEIKDYSAIYFNKLRLDIQNGYPILVGVNRI